MNIDKKLENLEKEIISQAEDECDKLREEYENKKNDMVSRQELIILSDAYNHIQKEKRQILKDKNNRILAASSEYRHKLANMRENMIDELFLDIKKRISDFTKSENYLAYLKNTIESVLSAFPNEKVSLVLYKDDRDYKDTLLKIEGVEEVSFTLEDNIGGFMVKGQTKGYDNTFKTLLERERKDFLKNVRMD